MNKVIHTILESDKEILESTKSYVYIYEQVRTFVDKYHLEDRTIGSVISFWLSIDCDAMNPGNPRLGYLFEVTMRKDITDCITKSIIHRFENDMDKLIYSNCHFELEKGL